MKAEVKAGQIIGGRFRIVERIGAGGMGVVFRAFDEQQQRAVAIKIIHTSTGDEVRRADHQPVDAVLIDRVTAGALADVEPARFRRELEQLLLDERVEQDEVGAAQAIDGAHREQLRVARPGADERHEAARRAHHRRCTIGRHA